MKRNNTRQLGFTLVELLVVIAIIASLAALVFVAANRAWGKAKLTGSVSQTKEIGLMVTMYSAENLDVLPVWHDYNRGMYWWELISEDLDTEGNEESFFKSPGHKEFDADAVAGTISYGWNYPVVGRHKGDGGYTNDHVLRISNFESPGSVLVFCDGARENSWGFIDPSSNIPDPGRYDGKVAGFFLDGSIKILKTPEEFGPDSEWFEPVKVIE
tara:strand:+ start:7247 stop:7888 length:642 start_codon:yes stop_codon:yes gene_type:complete